MPSIDNLWEMVIAVLLASAGGFARMLNAKDTTRLKLSRILSELFISAFAGLMILLLARASDLSGDWVGIVCGIAGWIGPKILDAITNKAGKLLGIEIDEGKGKGQ
jgi:hypothetical protein